MTPAVDPNVCPAWCDATSHGAEDQLHAGNPITAQGITAYVVELPNGALGFDFPEHRGHTLTLAEFDQFMLDLASERARIS